MATSSVDSSSKDGPGCPICLEVFTSPRQLPCLHSFCKHCIQDYITKKASSTEGIFENFMCPVCRSVTSPASKDKPVGEWASLFPHSPFPLVGISKVERRACEVCSSEQLSNLATKFCSVCEEFMCDNCTFYHQKMKMTKRHQMITQEEWENNPKIRIRFTEGLGCPEHDDKDMEFYCRTHEASCCDSCVLHYHEKCEGVLELKKNLSDLLQEMNPQNILNQMQNLEDHLKKFMDRNEENINFLETQVSSISAEVAGIREKLNNILDEIEEIVKLKANRLYKEWMIRKQEQNHQCQSLMNTIRNSQALLETVCQYGSNTQMFLVTCKTMKQLHTYNGQIREKFERVDHIRISLELDSNMKAVLSQDARGLVKVVCRKDGKDLHHPSIMRSLPERTVELSEVIDIHYPSGRSPTYTCIIELPEGDKVMSNYSSNTCCLFDSPYNFITSHILPGSPSGMCLIDNTEVAVTTSYEKTVQFLSIRDRSIRDTGTVRTRHPCDGVDAVSREEIVVSGPCSWTLGNNKCYWSLVNRNGKEKLYQEFSCTNAAEAYVSLDMPKSRVYISVSGGHAVYSFDLTTGKQYFVYTSDDLKYPMSMAVDTEDNVYVVGYASSNIHKLAADGVKLQVITSKVPTNPRSIFFNHKKDHFVITNCSYEQRSKVHYFVHTHHIY